MKRLTLILFAAMFMISSCSPAVQDPVESAENTMAPPEPTPTATEIPPVVFNICTAQLPQTLNPYSLQHNPAHAYVLTLLREYGLGNNAGVWQPGILEAVPSLDNGGIVLEPLNIQRGQRVMNVLGELVLAQEGTQVRPSGCRSNDCAITWNGVDTLEMDQMVVNFSLRNDLAWSDSTPVTGEDSVTSYQVSLMHDFDIPSWAAARTESFTAIDEYTIQWTGKPGFTTANFSEFFWLPLPSHLIGEVDNWDALSESQQNEVMNLGYGPYMLTGWHESEIQFDLNPHFPTSAQAKLEVDKIVIKQIDGGLEQAWDAFQTGSCDLLDTTFGLVGQHANRDMVLADENADLLIVPGFNWIQLVFGINPVIYDSGVNPMFTGRPDFFGDVRTRQGIAACLDREAMIDRFLPELSSAWSSFLPDEKSQIELDEGLLYDPESAIQFLEEVGWVKSAGADVIRVARNVPQVPNGTPLSLNLLVMETQFHQQLAEMIRESLSTCGVDIQINAMPAEDLYAPGPDGPLFGRDFDLALIAWQPLPEPDCGYYLSWQIPAEANRWVGTNTAGFSDPVYDRACMDASLALPSEFAGSLDKAEEAYLDLLPSIPLFAPPGSAVLKRSFWCSNDVFGSPAFFNGLRPASAAGDCPE